MVKVNNGKYNRYLFFNEYPIYLKISRENYAYVLSIRPILGSNIYAQKTGNFLFVCCKTSKPFDRKLEYPDLVIF